jgi:DNA invertase Pin-like site-specific DNA recombinase
MLDTAISKRAALYCRVSTDGQTTQPQEAELREIAERARWQITQVYIDQGISGARGRKDRPALDRMLRDCARRRFDLVAVTAVDRLGRSLGDLLSILGDIHAAGADLFIRREGFDTTSPSGRMSFSLMGLFAEFERNLIRERVLTGLARARARGQRLGRPRMPEAKRAQVRAALEAGGQSLRQIATQYRVGLGSVQRLQQELRQAA